MQSLKLINLPLQALRDYTNVPGLYKLTVLTELYVEELEYLTLSDDEIGVLTNLKYLTFDTLKGFDFPMPLNQFTSLNVLRINRSPKWESPEFMAFNTFADSLSSLHQLIEFRMMRPDLLWVCPDNSLSYIAKSLMHYPPHENMQLDQCMFPLKHCWRELRLPSTAAVWTNNTIFRHFKENQFQALYYYSMCYISEQRHAIGSHEKETHMLVSGLDDSILQMITYFVLNRDII